MSNPSALGAICYEQESAFGENVSTFATLRLPILDPVDPSGITQAKIDTSRTQQYLQGGQQWILGIKGGSFKMSMWLPGHGSTTAGATTASATETFLGLVFGNATISAASGTTYTGAGTAIAPTTTASGTFASGSICFNGALGDTHGGAQAAAVSTHAATTLNLLTALGGIPANNDVLYSANNIYLPESPTSATVTSCRFLLQTGNLMYECHGCYPSAVSITGLNPGETPKIEITWTVAWWQYSTATFPSAVATDTSLPAPVAAGSLFVNDVGTATRVTRTCRDFKIDIKLGVVPLLGPGGVDSRQVCVGARRIPSDITIMWSEDADAATTTPVAPGFGTGTTNKHVLYTVSTGIGSRIAFYAPAVAANTVAIQKIDKNINRVTFSGKAYTGGTTTTDLTASALRMAFA